MKATTMFTALAALCLGACDFDVADPNNPGPIGPDPSRVELAAAAVGIIIAARTDAADWILDAGILGREAYRFDGSDPRFTGELMEGPLDAGGGAFGGDHWLEEYAAIRAAFELLNVLPTATRLNTAERSATRGFAETMQALMFIWVMNGHDTDSIPLDVNPATAARPAPFVTNDSAYTFVSALLDSADTHLAAAATTPFPFVLPPGFTGFNTPATFRQFNRALKARVEVYRGSRGCVACYTRAKTVLETPGATFIDTSGAATLSRGVYIDYSTGAGDIVNPLFQNPQTGENFTHPQLDDSTETRVAGGPDNRFTAKVVTRTLSSAGDPPLSSNLGWIRYASSVAPIPIVRNEELILLRAEANNATGNPALAAADVNYIRITSGGLAACGVAITCPVLATAADTTIRNEILRQRRFSLLYEGHRWVDVRRLGLLNRLPIDRPRDKLFATLPTPLSVVLARQ
jgi:starch-binding outer membrane protein, SusD/RagB family